MATIPASSIVQVNPSVLSAGGLGVALTGMFLTESTRVPIGTSPAFVSAASVAAYFGPNSPEANAAAIYFAGFIHSNVKPSQLQFTQYPGVAVAAYLRGAPVSGIPLATLGTYTGSLTVLVDGYTHTAASVNLSGASSYSNAAAIINTALTASEPTEATSSAATIAGAVLTVGGTITGTFAVGQTITGSGVTAGSVIISLGTGTGAAGTYNLSASSTVGSPEAILAVATAPVVSYDSVSGSFIVTSGITGSASTIAFATGTIAPLILLTSATGAVLSQGAAATTPAAFMTALAQSTQTWACFMTMFDPDGGSGNTQKLAFATWNAQQDDRYSYVCWDTDAQASVAQSTECLGYILKQNAADGTELIGAVTDYTKAAMVCGFAASIDFTQLKGRATLAFKTQSGIAPDVTSQQTAANLIANGYNYYGAYAEANNGWTFYYPGSISGQFLWADSYLNQIWLNTGFQNNLMTLLTQVKSVPYNSAGYALIEAACLQTIQAGLNFGAFGPGSVLSPLQIAEVNQAAGADIAGTLVTQGYYFQVLPASPSSRGARTTPPINFWYCDNGSVQQISLASIEVQ